MSTQKIRVYVRNNGVRPVWVRFYQADRVRFVHLGKPFCNDWAAVPMFTTAFVQKQPVPAVVYPEMEQQGLLVMPGIARNIETPPFNGALMIVTTTIEPTSKIDPNPLPSQLRSPDEKFHNPNYFVQYLINPSGLAQLVGTEKPLTANTQEITIPSNAFDTSNKLWGLHNLPHCQLVSSTYPSSKRLGGGHRQWFFRW
jgi:hypothetical protein